MLLLLEEESFVDERSSFILKKNVFEFIENVHCNFLSVSSSELSVLFLMSSLYIFTFILFSIRVEFVPQKL